MFGDMMDKLKQMQQSVEESKARLSNITVKGEANGVVVQMNGNRKMTDVQINDELMVDKEALEDFVMLACNRALEQAEKVYEAEMASSAKGIIPGL